MIGGKKKATGGKKAVKFADPNAEAVREIGQTIRTTAMLKLLVAFALTLVIAIGLPIIYLVYLKRLEDQNCVCATSHELFQRLRVIVVVQLAFTILLPLLTFLPKSFSMTLSLVVAIVMATTFLIWFRDMAALKCLCTRGWEKNVWLVMSVIDATFFVLYVIAAVMTGLIRN